MDALALHKNAHIIQRIEKGTPNASSMNILSRDVEHKIDAYNNSMRILAKKKDWKKIIVSKHIKTPTKKKYAGFIYDNYRAMEQRARIASASANE